MWGLPLQSHNHQSHEDLFVGLNDIILLIMFTILNPRLTIHRYTCTNFATNLFGGMKRKLDEPFTVTNEFIRSHRLYKRTRSHQNLVYLSKSNVIISHQFKERITIMAIMCTTIARSLTLNQFYICEVTGITQMCGQYKVNSTEQHILPISIDLACEILEV